jgi:hypothetical protein
MFDALDETIRKDEAKPMKERLVLALAVFVIAVAVFGGLYLLVRVAA